MGGAQPGVTSPQATNRCEGWEQVLLPEGTRAQPLSSGRILCSTGEKLPCSRCGGTGVQGALWFSTGARWRFTSFTSIRFVRATGSGWTFRASPWNTAQAGKVRQSSYCMPPPGARAWKARGHPLGRPESPACSAPAASSGGPQQLALSRSPGSPELSGATRGDGGCVLARAPLVPL